MFEVDEPLFSYVFAAVIVALVALAAFFASGETALMALNRHRLKHFVALGHRGALRAQHLLQVPDRFVGFVLLGNRFIIILLTQLITLAALHWYGEDEILLTSLGITAVVVVFVEIVPKTIAALNPERVAFPASLLLLPLMWLSLPLVSLLNLVTRGLLQPLVRGVPRAALDPMDREELRVVVKEAGAMIPQKHRDMLFGLLDLENVTVEDIMVPRPEIVGLDLEGEWVDILQQLTTCRHTRVPCYRGNLDAIVGILHLRNLTRLLRQSREFGVTDLEQLLVPAHFVPAGADLYTQLLNFQIARQRLALVVDEYGDIQGLVTLDDLLEQVVGEFTTVPQFDAREAFPQADGSFVVEGTANIRELNRALGWSLPEHGPKTLNGLILEALEDIPEAGTSFRLGEYTIEIVHGTNQTVRNARIFPPQAAASAGGNPQPGD